MSPGFTDIMHTVLARPGMGYECEQVGGGVGGVSDHFSGVSDDRRGWSKRQTYPRCGSHPLTPYNCALDGWRLLFHSAKSRIDRAWTSAFVHGYLRIL